MLSTALFSLLLLGADPSPESLPPSLSFDVADATIDDQGALSLFVSFPKLVWETQNVQVPYSTTLPNGQTEARTRTETRQVARTIIDSRKEVLDKARFKVWRDEKLIDESAAGDLLKAPHQVIVAVGSTLDAPRTSKMLSVFRPEVIVVSVVEAPPGEPAPAAPAPVAPMPNASPVRAPAPPGIETAPAPEAPAPPAPAPPAPEAPPAPAPPAPTPQ